MPQLNLTSDSGHHLDEEAVAKVLHEADTPVMLRHAGASWQVRSLAALLALHGDAMVKVVTSGGVYRGEGKVEVEMPLRDFGSSLRNGTVPSSSYVFQDLSGLPLAASAGEACDLFARVSRLRDPGYAAVPFAARGRPILSVGGWGHGRPFHSHGPALNGLASGVKHWFVRRPNASAELTVPAGLQGGAGLADGWESQGWQCTQREGDVLWIPDRYEHATANFADDTVAIFTVIDDLSDTPLHAAAKAGDEAAVRALLEANGDVAARSRSGGTALTYAAGVGSVQVMRLLIAAGAQVGDATRSGAQALHAAAFGGHHAAVRLLLASGASTDARDARGKTAMQLATELGHAEVREALEQAEAAAAAAAAAASGGAAAGALADSEAGASKIAASQLLARAGAHVAEGHEPRSRGGGGGGGGEQASCASDASAT